MRVAPRVDLKPEQREALEQRSRARSLPSRVVERARIVLRAAAGKQAALFIQRAQTQTLKSQMICVIV